MLHRKNREIEMRESLLLYAGYFSVGVLFGAWVWYELGAQSALEFYTGFWSNNRYRWTTCSSWP